METSNDSTNRLVVVPDPDLEIRGGGEGGSHPVPDITGGLVFKKFISGLSLVEN